MQRMLLWNYTAVLRVYGGLGCLNGSTIRQCLIICQHKNRSPENFQIYNLLSTKLSQFLSYMFDIGIKTSVILWPTKLHRVFTFNFRILKKITPSGVSFFRQKRIFLNITLTLSWIKKNFLWFCRAKNSNSIDISINCVGWTVRLFDSLPWTPFLRFLWITRFLWRQMKKKFRTANPF